MKIYLIIFNLLMVFGSGCQKEENRDKELPKDISGTWDWILTFQGVYLTLTPENTGIRDILVFGSDKTWSRTQNNIKVDSGTYSIGHGNYLPYIGAYNFVYDSIIFYNNGHNILGWDYYSISNDTLLIAPGLGGRYSSVGSYLLLDNGSIRWIKIR
jgi:hypothetical protein